MKALICSWTYWGLAEILITSPVFIFVNVSSKRSRCQAESQTSPQGAGGKSGWPAEGGWQQQVSADSLSFLCFLEALMPFFCYSCSGLAQARKAGSRVGRVQPLRKVQTKRQLSLTGIRSCKSIHPASSNGKKTSFRRSSTRLSR